MRLKIIVILFGLLSIFYAWYKADPLNSGKWFSMILFIVAISFVSLLIFIYLPELTNTKENDKKKTR